MYELIIKEKHYKEQHSSSSWVQDLDIAILWENVWKSVHNPLALEVTKSKIWEQIHLFDYNTYSYNIWHQDNKHCPLCLLIPESKYHLILNCPTTRYLWDCLAPFLQNLHYKPITSEEMAFGMEGNTANIILRNWLTFLLRECIINQENIAYRNKLGLHNITEIKCAFNARLKKEILQSHEYHDKRGTMHIFEHKYRANGVFLKFDEEIQHYTIPKIFDTT